MYNIYTISYYKECKMPLKVEVTGRGDCMYNAYSVSLMYYLRKKKDNDLTTRIFARLRLTPDKIDQLNAILAKNPNEEISRTDIEQVIEPILGKAARNLTADATVEQYTADPKGSSLFTAANYGIEYYFKLAMQGNNSNLERLIVNDNKNVNFNDAEIYRVQGIRGAMEEFAKIHRRELEIEYQDRLQKELKNHQGATPEQIDDYKKNILAELINKQTLNFLDEHLEEYRKHLQTGLVYATEENLMVLHRAIQNEQTHKNIKGSVDFTYENPIQLYIYIGGRPAYGRDGQPSEMILNHTGKEHWNSFIPDSIFKLKIDERVTITKDEAEQINNVMRRFTGIENMYEDVQLAFFLLVDSIEKIRSSGDDVEQYKASLEFMKLYDEKKGLFEDAGFTEFKELCTKIISKHKPDTPQAASDTDQELNKIAEIAEIVQTAGIIKTSCENISARRRTDDQIMAAISISSAIEANLLIIKDIDKDAPSRIKAMIGCIEIIKENIESLQSDKVLREECTKFLELCDAYVLSKLGDPKAVTAPFREAIVTAIKEIEETKEKLASYERKAPTPGRHH